MRCTNCGTENADNMTNCTVCGAALGFAGAPAAYPPGPPMQPYPVQEPPAKKKKSLGLILGIAIGVVVIVAAALIMFMVVIPKQNYDKAMALYESKNYVEALAAFNNMGDYEESARYARLCQEYIDYNKAVEAFEAGDYDTAYDIFIELGDFEDSAKLAKDCLLFVEYNKALALYNEGFYEEAYLAFLALGGFHDSAQKAQDCIQPFPAAGLYRKGSGYAAADDGTLFSMRNNMNRDIIVYVFLEDETNWGAIACPANGADPVAVSIKPGVYFFCYKIGDNWFGDDELFGTGEDAGYYVIKFGGEKLLTLEAGVANKYQIGG